MAKEPITGRRRGIIGSAGLAAAETLKGVPVGAAEGAGRGAFYTGLGTAAIVGGTITAVPTILGAMWGAILPAATGVTALSAMAATFSVALPVGLLVGGGLGLAAAFGGGLGGGILGAFIGPFRGLGHVSDRLAKEQYVADLTDLSKQQAGVQQASIDAQRETAGVAKAQIIKSVVEANSHMQGVSPRVVNPSMAGHAMMVSQPEAAQGVPGADGMSAVERYAQHRGGNSAVERMQQQEQQPTEQQV